MPSSSSGESDWYSATTSYGGVGAYNSFTNATANVCFVFTNGNGNRPAWVGDTGSHEAGHSFGLYHQSTFDANGDENLEYSLGDITTWSPIPSSSTPPRCRTSSSRSARPTRRRGQPRPAA